MKVLLVKTSSMGDVIHSFPAVTDAARMIPDLQLDWVVEEAFVDLPQLHPHVRQVIPCAIRRWRKHPFETWRSGEWKQFKQQINDEQYDQVIDAQGLVKSAYICRKVNNTPLHGYAADSIREPWAARFYSQHHQVSWQQHAVERVRQLFAQSLGYSVPQQLDYGFSREVLPANKWQGNAPYLVFIHATTWPEKHYPENQWRQLASLAENHQQRVLIPWANATEKARAQRIAEGFANVEVLPKMALAELAPVLAGASGCIAVDTGLGHLCAALAVPTVSLYGPTDPRKIGAYGHHQVFMSAKFPLPDYAHSLSQFGFADSSVSETELMARLPSAEIWGRLQELQAGMLAETPGGRRDV